MDYYGTEYAVYRRILFRLGVRAMAVSSMHSGISSLERICWLCIFWVLQLLGASASAAPYLPTWEQPRGWRSQEVLWHVSRVY